MKDLYQKATNLGKKLVVASGLVGLLGGCTPPQIIKIDEYNCQKEGFVISIFKDEMRVAIKDGNEYWFPDKTKIPEMLDVLARCEMAFEKKYNKLYE